MGHGVRFAKLTGEAFFRKITRNSCDRHRLFSRTVANMSPARDTLCLFDVDGTLTAPRKVVEPHIYKFLIEEVKSRSCIGLVGGSDFSKMAEQMGGENFLADFDYAFPENGLIAFKDGKEIGRQSIQTFLGEERLKKFINYTLLCLSEIDIPVKRGTFIEFRTGMLNISPIGRSCNRTERNDFEQYDKQHNVRQKLIDRLKSQFPDLGLTYSIGGQISFDVFPIGWDKTFSLNFVEKSGFREIHFFGDKVDKGGNDFEIYNDPRVIGHRVTSHEQIKEHVCNALKL